MRGSRLPPPLEGKGAAAERAAGEVPHVVVLRLPEGPRSPPPPPPSRRAAAAAPFPILLLLRRQFEEALPQAKRKDLPTWRPSRRRSAAGRRGPSFFGCRCCCSADLFFVSEVGRSWESKCEKSGQVAAVFHNQDICSFIVFDFG